MGPVDLWPHQVEAVKNLGNGCILTGKPGSGKSVVALQYYVERVLKVRHPADLGRRLAEGPRLVIITTARKRDDLDWQGDVAMYGLTHYTTVDSWNNISNYRNIRDSFILDAREISPAFFSARAMLFRARYSVVLMPQALAISTSDMPWALSLSLSARKP